MDSYIILFVNMNRTADLYVNEFVMAKHKVIVMPSDGNCMFHAIDFSLHNSLDNQRSLQIRLAIVDYVFSNWKDLSLLTSNEKGEPFDSKMNYRRSMSQLSTFGAASELKAAAHLYSIKIEVYQDQDGILLALFGEEWPLTKRFLLSGNLSSGHYDVCLPIDHENLNEIIISYNNVQAETTENPKYTGKRAMKRKRGRPKTSNKSRAVQLREANQRYRQTHPEVNRKAVARYTKNNPEIHQRAVERYAKNKPEIHQKCVDHYSRKNLEVNEKAAHIYQAKKKLSFKDEVITIKRLTGKIKNQLEAEKLVK